ncbi:MAG: hypothetical protein HXK82_11245 [Lachnospiraceae bacterium]|nr:hypothetical protein [Lachnospiraceae bacterium]
MAVFTADVTSNPHCFDERTAAGQLLVHASFCITLSTSVRKYIIL